MAAKSKMAAEYFGLNRPFFLDYPICTYTQKFRLAARSVTHSTLTASTIYVPIPAPLVEAVSVRKQVMSYTSGTKSDSLLMGRYWVNKNICSIQPKIFSHHLWFWRPSWIFLYFGLKMVISIPKHGNIDV